MLRIVLAAAGSAAALATSPAVLLGNAAAPGVYMPVTGLGTGGYCAKGQPGPSGQCECWGESDGCGATSYNATLAYLQLAWSMGERNIRIDNADSYDNLGSVGKAIADSGVPRANIFLTTKTGSPFPLGFDDTMSQFSNVLTTMGVSYVDLCLCVRSLSPRRSCPRPTPTILTPFELARFEHFLRSIHWPQESSTSKDATCNPGASQNATECRLNTWRAYVDIFKSGKARAIGISNYDPSQMQEIIDAGMPLPAVNQIPIHIYRSSTQMNSISFSQRHGIAVNSYSPLGVPDWQSFNTSAGMSLTALQDPVVTAVAAKHGASPAQVLSAWHYSLGLLPNPRTLNPAHMKENLLAYTITISDAEVNLLTSRPQAFCSVMAGDYECAPDSLASSARRAVRPGARAAAA
jgi:diketogulonate reductase-like aldo/keto reductase